MPRAALDPASRTMAPPRELAVPSSTILQVPGLNASGANCTCAAPDLAVLAGPNSVLEVTPSEVLAYATDTGARTLVPTRALWGNSSSTITRVAGTFDPRAERFLVAAANPAPTYPSVLLRASQGTNPLAGWNSTAILLPSAVGFARLSVAVGGGALGIAGTEVNASTGTIIACPIWVVNESDVLAGRYYPFGTPAPLGVACPADGSPNAWVATSPPGGPITFVEQNTSTELRVEQVRGVPPGPFLVQNLTFPLRPRSDPHPLSEPGTNSTLAAPAPGVASAAAEGGNLSAVGTVSLAGVDAVRLLVLNLTTASLLADTVVAPGPGLADPAVVADARDDLAVAATASNSTVDPSLVTFGRPSGEVGWTTPVAWVENGTTIVRTPCNATGVCAWGNGSALAVNPSDPSTIWFAGLYAGAVSERWSSAVGLAAYPPVSVPLLSSDAVAVDVGQQENFTAVVTGGVGGDSYNWSASPPPGCLSRNSSVMRCNATTAGSFPVEVAVHDASGRGALSPPGAFVVDPALAVPAPSPSPRSADVGQTVRWSVVPTEGRGPYQFRWTASAGTTCAPSTGPTANCTSALAGRAAVSVTVTDRNLQVRSNASTLLVLSAPTLQGLVIDPDPTVVGTPVNLSIDVRGGSGGYTIAWSDLPNGCVSVDRTNFTCVPEETGNFSVTVSANDTNGLIALANGTLSVGPAPPASPAPPAPAPPWVLPALLGGIAVVVGAAVVVLGRRRRPGAIVPVDDPEAPAR